MTRAETALCSILTLAGCSAQADADACVEVARAIDADAVHERVPITQLEGLSERCGWVYRECDSKALFEMGVPGQVHTTRLVEHCAVPSCPLGPRGSPACETHWREVLANERPPEALREALVAFHRAQIDDQLGRMRAKLDTEGQTAIAEAWTRIWFEHIAMTMISISPPKLAPAPDDRPQ